MKLIVFIIILFIPIYSYARIIRGTVADERNTPIAFANVVVLDKDSTFLAGVVTDSAGAFFFDALPATSEVIKISCVGYDDYYTTIPVGDNPCVVRMKPSLNVLGEVVVKVSLPMTKVRDNALVTTVANTILADAGTANDVLAKIPMVTGSEGQFSVFGAGTPVIYINGRIVRNTVELEQLSSKEIKSVEVCTNPDARYSAEANAVIRIKTVPPKGEGFSVSLSNSTRIAHFAENSNDLFFKYRHKGLEIFAQGFFLGGKRRSHELSSMTTYADAIFLQNLESFTTNSNTDCSVKFGFNYQVGEKHSFGTYYKTARYKNKSKGTLNTDITYNAQAYQQLHQNHNGTELIQPSHEANIYYNGSIDRLSIDFNADYLQTNKNTDDIQKEQDEETDNRIVQTHAANKNHLFAEKLVMNYPLWNGTFEVGEEYTNSHINYQSHYTGADITGGNTKIKESNIAAFAQLTQQFGLFRVGVGLRFEHVKSIYSNSDEGDSYLSRTYNNWFPSFSLSCKIKEVGLSFNLTSHTRRPSYRQLDGTLHYVNRYSYRIGNPALKSAYRHTAQLMAQWKFFFAQAAYSHEKNSIFYATERYMDDPLIKMIVFKNIPKYQHFQFVVGAQPTIDCWHPQITIGLLNSFYKTQFLDENKRLNRPIFFGNWNNSILLPRNWSIDVDCMVQTAGNAQNCYIKTVSYMNMSIRKLFLNKTLSVQLKINDIFNTNNERIIMYNGDIKVGTDNYKESRHIVLSLRYNFNVSRSKYSGKGAGTNEKKRL